MKLSRRNRAKLTNLKAAPSVSKYARKRHPSLVAFSREDVAFSREDIEQIIEPERMEEIKAALYEHFKGDA